jgi:hypothetical protein
MKTGIGRRGDSNNRKRFTDEESSSAPKRTSESMFGYRLMERGGEAEERIARRGDISKTGGGSVWSDPRFSDTNQIGVEGVSNIEDLRRAIRMKQGANIERKNREAGGRRTRIWMNVTIQQKGETYEWTAAYWSTNRKTHDIGNVTCSIEAAILDCGGLERRKIGWCVHRKGKA